MLQESYSSAFQFQPVNVLMLSPQLTSSTCQRFQYLQNYSSIQLRILSTDIEKELKVLDFVFWLNSYFVFLCFFPFVSTVFTSLIKFALWNLGEIQEARVFLQTRDVRSLESQDSAQFHLQVHRWRGILPRSDPKPRPQLIQMTFGYVGLRADDGLD